MCIDFSGVTGVQVKNVLPLFTWIAPPNLTNFKISHQLKIIFENYLNRDCCTQGIPHLSLKYFENITSLSSFFFCVRQCSHQFEIFASNIYDSLRIYR